VTIYGTHLPLLAGPRFHRKFKLIFTIFVFNFDLRVGTRILYLKGLLAFCFCTSCMMFILRLRRAVNLCCGNSCKCGSPKVIILGTQLLHVAQVCTSGYMACNAFRVPRWKSLDGSGRTLTDEPRHLLRRRDASSSIRTTIPTYGTCAHAKIALPHSRCFLASCMSPFPAQSPIATYSQIVVQLAIPALAGGARHDSKGRSGWCGCSSYVLLPDP